MSTEIDRRGKALYIAEKPSVAQEFARVLGVNGARRDGYLENEEAIVTWCVGHLVTMSYPEAYDERLRRWSMESLPFLPQEFKYEVIDSVKKQFGIVAKLLNRPDVETIYVCTDSGREGEYIYRLVEQLAGVKEKKRCRVWIDSQTEEEILKGIRQARDLSDYDNLAASAYLRAKEDYLMGINFSRVLTLQYGPSISRALERDRTVVSVGRVMTCVLGMVVRREREIRSFVPTPFFRVVAQLRMKNWAVDAEWRVTPDSRYAGAPCLYRDNGFREKKQAQELLEYLKGESAGLRLIEKKLEKKQAPLLYNLAELQNDCARLFKLSPDDTLKVAQELYEKKLITYPRTDARVLSTAVAQEIGKNLKGLTKLPMAVAFAGEILEKGLHRGISRTRYVNDKQITDHYAIIPTGQGLAALVGLSARSQRVYEAVVRRFLCIFYPPAQYQRFSLEFLIKRESFFATFRARREPGYLVVMDEALLGEERAAEGGDNAASSEVERTEAGEKGEKEGGCKNRNEELKKDPAFFSYLSGLRKGGTYSVDGLTLREGETSPPRRYSSGSIILAMENAGQLIEDEELRAQIKGSGIGTSATRAEILKKLVSNQHLSLNVKTQIIVPTLLGELIYDVVDSSIRSLLNPELTASWEKGLTLVAEGTITDEEYMEKLTQFIVRRVEAVRRVNNSCLVQQYAERIRPYYPKKEEGRRMRKGRGNKE